MTKLKKEQIDETVQRIYFQASTWGKLEAAAGIADRVAFWKDHPTEETARVAVRAMIAERVRKGEIKAEG